MHEIDDLSDAQARPLTREQLLECLLFVADGPAPVSQLAEALELSKRETEAALAALEAACRERGLRLQRWQDHVQLTTAAEAAPYVERFLGLSATTRLSHAALETLAIVAYQQPVTRPQIEAVRGVNSDSVIKSLLSKGLVEEVGRSEGVGRPILYQTTPEFLQHFGLTSLEVLPPLNLQEALAQTVAQAEGPAPNGAQGAEMAARAAEAGEARAPAAEAEPAATGSPSAQEAETALPDEAQDLPPADLDMANVTLMQPGASPATDPQESTAREESPAEAALPPPRPPWQGDWAPVEEDGTQSGSASPDGQGSEAL